MRQAERRKFHYIYKITRTDGSGKYYIGLHSTDNLDDGYFGSGQLLWKSIKKHGKEKHLKEIIEFLPCRITVKAREKELVNLECLADPLCMNLKLGGEGGWEHISKETLKRGYWSMINTMTPEKRALSAVKSTETKRTRGTFSGWSCKTGMKDKNHSEATKQQMSISQRGKNNSQFGTCWIHKNGSNQKIKLDLLPSFLENGFERGRSKQIRGH